jgi:tight adherence protein B
MAAQLTLFLAVLFLVIGPALILLWQADRRQQIRKARLARAVAGCAIVTETARPTAVRTIRSRAGLMAALDCKIQQAGLDMDPRVVIALMLVAAVLLGGFLHLMLDLPLVFAALIALAGSALALSILLSQLYERRMTAVVAHLPEALDAFARGLKAGRPVADALALVVDSTAEPLRQELAQSRDMLTLGHDLAETLRQLAHRLPAPEIRFFSAATQLQAETGGNLVETIENLAGQLRQRRAMRKKIRALSAEARASAMILGLLPFAVALLLFVINPGYLRPLISDPRGVVMTGLGLISLTAGMIILTRMGRLDV